MNNKLFMLESLGLEFEEVQASHDTTDIFKPIQEVRMGVIKNYVGRGLDALSANEMRVLLAATKMVDDTAKNQVLLKQNERMLDNDDAALRLADSIYKSRGLNLKSDVPVERDLGVDQVVLPERKFSDANKHVGIVQENVTEFLSRVNSRKSLPSDS